MLNEFHASVTTCKVSEFEDLSGPHFPVFGPNTQIYSVNLRIQSEYGKTSNLDTSHEFGYYLSFTVFDLF